MTRKPTPSEPQTSTIWGGRFQGGPSAVMEQINASIGFDRRLYAQDIAASKAHCAMLVAQEIINEADGTAIQSGLDQILTEIAADQFEFRVELEDIHMNIETRLRALIGDAAGRLHTARSRNDQVATDFKLWVRDAFDQLDQDIEALQRSLIAKAETHAATVMPAMPACA
jgi:argininosuccinate lyase